MGGDEPKVTRRRFFGTVGAAVVGVASGRVAGAADTPREDKTPQSKKETPKMPGISDGLSSPLFETIALNGNSTLAELKESDLSRQARNNVDQAPAGECVCWGIPFSVDRVALATTEPVVLRWDAVTAPWLVLMHTTDIAGPARNEQGFFTDPRGQGLLGEHVADYVLLYADGSEERVAIRRRHQIGMMSKGWGTNCFQAVAHVKPHPMPTTSEQSLPGLVWGWSQTRVANPDGPAWINWLWGWENPRPGEPIVGLRIEPKSEIIILSAVSAGQVTSLPLRWERRQKAVLTLPQGAAADLGLTHDGLLKHLQLDLGQVISAQRRTVYPNDSWARTYDNKVPDVSSRELLVEYTAHPDARFHLEDGTLIPASEVAVGGAGALVPIAAATQRVRMRVLDKATNMPVAVRLHVHGEAGEYLAPLDRHRIPNPFWYEDWSADYINPNAHFCTYIPGETVIDLPVGNVYVEISKGFEVKPIRRVVRVSEGTRTLTFAVERVLPWRDRGWVTADTHVHFLSPPTAELEGAGTGVNVVNLLASQWGELMTNVGDFDGRTTFGSRDAGGDGEYLVRVGTENRQHILGHISLLGYNGPIIAPMTTGGPDESALGDPIDVLLTEWARQCRKQGGIVILPHFPNPRAEHAAAIVRGDIDGVEMTAWSNLYAGIDPYSLSDWYRYLNCGQFVAAVGGTDKMASSTAVGTVRTYAKIADGAEFSYDAWKDAVRAGHTFVTYGPLMEFAVEGSPPGSRLKLGRKGGTLDVSWKVASVTIPMKRVDLIVNGVVAESVSVGKWDGSGNWSVPVDRSSWLGLLVRGHYADQPEMLAAHSSPVMAEVQGTQFFSAADAISILDQIEGALAYLDTVGTRAETTAYRRMRMVLTGSYRTLHNRLHQAGVFHDHTPSTEH